MFKLKHNLSSLHLKAFEKYKNDPSEENKKEKENLVGHVQSLNLKIYDTFLENHTNQIERVRKAYFNFGVNQDVLYLKVTLLYFLFLILFRVSMIGIK